MEHRRMLAHLDGTEARLRDRSSRQPLRYTALLLHSCTRGLHLHPHGLVTIGQIKECSHEEHESRVHATPGRFDGCEPMTRESMGANRTRAAAPLNDWSAGSAAHRV